MKQKGKTVSAVIPTLNRSNYLREAVSSVLNQSYPVLEVIVIDDGSSEDIKQALAD
ncbi:MAG: glycosyltransferase family A protein, partial [Cyclobacteriaceae bacterium]